MDNAFNFVLDSSLNVVPLPRSFNNSTELLKKKNRYNVVITPCEGLILAQQPGKVEMWPSLVPVQKHAYSMS